MTYHRVCRKSITTGATSGAGTAYTSEEPKFSPDFSGVRVTRSLVFCVIFVHPCLSFCNFPFLAIVLSVLRFTASDYPFGTFKLFYIHEYVVCPFVLFLLAIVLPVLLRYTDYDVSNVF